MGICSRRFKIELPNDAVSVPLVRDFTDGIAGALGFDEDEKEDIKAAVSEAVENVILHAFAPGEEASFEVLYEPSNAGLRVVISDMGMPLDTGRFAEVCDTAVSGVDKTGSSGICIMKRRMDEVSFHNLGREGKQIRLFKRIRGMPVTTCMSKAELREADEERRMTGGPQEAGSFIVRRLDPEESVEVSKCAYSAYHYSYFYEYMYFPEQVKRLNETGEMISYVAVSEKSLIVGHAAIREDKGSGAAELMAAFVKPGFRGRGCLNAITEELIEQGRRMGLTGLYVRAVTSHPYSQKTASKYGFKGCGLFLAQHDPPEFIGITSGKSVRESMLNAFLYLKPAGRFRIFPPPKHREMIMRLYERLGAGPESGDEEAAFPQADSSVAVTVEPYHTARIEVLSCGRDVLSEVKGNLRSLCLARTEVIYLFLNLCDPLTRTMTSGFEEMGFFFCGITPGAPGKDRLVLQFLNNLALNYDSLKFASDADIGIMEYIRRQDPANLV